MTRQLAEGATAEAIQVLATTSAIVAGAAAGSSAIMNTLISGSLSQLWGMINAMQILVHLSVLNVDFPATAQLVTSNIIMVATFDIPFLNTDTILSPVATLPDEEGPRIEKTKDNSQMIDALDSLGYSSRYFARIMGSVYLFILLTTVGLCLMIFLLAIKQKYAWAVKPYA